MGDNFLCLVCPPRAPVPYASRVKAQVLERHSQVATLWLLPEKKIQRHLYLESMKGDPISSQLNVLVQLPVHSNPFL